MDNLLLFSHFICIVGLAIQVHSASDGTKCLYNFNFHDASKQPSCTDYINNKLKGLKDTVEELEAEIKERKSISSQRNEKCQKKAYSISFTGMNSEGIIVWQGFCEPCQTKNWILSVNACLICPTSHANRDVIIRHPLFDCYKHLY